MRISITPFIICVVVLPAYFFKLIHSQTSFIVVLLIAGIAGQVIQYYVQEWHKKKNGIKTEKKKVEIETEEVPLSKLPKEVQDLIKEAESLNDDEQRSDKAL